MKRLTYISRFARHLPADEIEKIREASSRNNQRNGITGVLIYLRGIFFQILEGEDAQVDAVFARISRDSRHAEILCLKSECGVGERLFPSYSMEVFNLEENQEIYIQPIKTLLQNITESHRILEKYTQPTVFKIINTGVNPLMLHPKKVGRIVLFSDIIGFSSFVEILPEEEVIALVNRYFGVCTDVLMRNGGEVTKFIGDCVMAYFDAYDGDAALRAGLDLLAELKALRDGADSEDPTRYLRAGIGLDRGTVIEGNIGSSTKKDYTIIGDAVNVASRLEALTRELGPAMLFSGRVKEVLRADWACVPVRAFLPKGRTGRVSVFTLDHALVDSGVREDDGDIREQLADLMRRRSEAP